jgi:Leucine Rich repeat
MNKISINSINFCEYSNSSMLFALKNESGNKKELVFEKRSEIEKYPYTYSSNLKTIVTAWHQADQIKLKNMESLHSIVDRVNQCVEKHNDKFLNRLFCQTLTPIDTNKPLNICLSDSQPKMLDTVIEMIKTNTNIRKIDFSEMAITPEIAEKLARSIKQNTTLQSIKLTQKSGSINQLALETLCEALKHHPTLSTLSLSQCDLQNDNIQPVCNLLKNNKVIKNLKLDHTKMTSKEAKLICEAARVHGSLEKLNLYWNNLGPIGARSIADILSTNPRLKRLEIGGNQFDKELSDGLRKLTAAIANHPSLQHLSFYYNYFDSASIDLIANAIKQNQSISYVDLGAGLIKKDSPSYQILRDSLKGFPNSRKIRYSEWEGLFALGALVGGPLTFITYCWENTTKCETTPGILQSHR